MAFYVLCCMLSYFLNFILREYNYSLIKTLLDARKCITLFILYTLPDCYAYVRIIKSLNIILLILTLVHLLLYFFLCQ